MPYQRRTIDEIDKKLVTHVKEYRKITNKTVQNLLDVSLQKAADILADWMDRGLLVKTSAHERGPGVEYGPGPQFPGPKLKLKKGSASRVRRPPKR